MKSSQLNNKFKVMMILDSNDYNTVKKIKKQVMLTKNAFQFFLFYDCNMY